MNVLLKIKYTFINHNRDKNCHIALIIKLTLN